MMKSTAAIISLLLLISFSVNDSKAFTRSIVRTTATGDGASVNVDINNNYNSKSTTTSVSGESTTKIDIEQNGGGTSSVTVNGKEYKVEGTGSLHVDETSSLTPTPKGSTIITPTPSISSTENARDAQKENQTFLKSFFENLSSYFENLFSSLFK